MLMYVTWRFANAEDGEGKCFEGKVVALVAGLAMSNHHSSLLTVLPLLSWVSGLCTIECANIPGTNIPT